MLHHLPLDRVECHVIHKPVSYKCFDIAKSIHRLLSPINVYAICFRNGYTNRKHIGCCKTQERRLYTRKVY